MKKEKVKINKENLFKSKARMSYLQIFLLILSSFAFSYIIYESSKLLDGKGENINKLKQEIKNKKVLLIASFFKAWISRSKINLVSAQESISLNCCPKLKNNAVCQEILASNCNNECSVNCLPAKCELTSSCKLGCCFNSEEGTCSNSATKGKCEEDGGMWKDDKNCNIQECNLGCCILGSNTQFVTEKRCDKLASFYGYAFDFKPGIRTEIECLLLSNQQAEGACIIGEEEGKNLCEFTSKADCLKMIGNANKFYENYLCSNPSLNTGCEKQKTTSCVEGKDEVYWFDSCGNRENIFSEDKDKSWNSGKLLKKEESCNPNSANSESKSCGNCNYFLGSICGKSDDGKEKVCKSLDCKNAPDNVGKKDRRNGESWCVFDSYIGEGKDVPGSRHYKYYCLDGEVKAEACGDYRTGICVSDEIELGNNKKISQAACRLNRALECQGYNIKKDEETTKEQKERMKRECLENEDCEIKKFDFGEGYKFEVCTPKYPIGFDLTRDEGETAKKLCNQASFKCTKIMVHKIGGWECVAGCDCDKKEFTQKMNDWCVSLGDCGGYVNLLGETSDYGYSVSKAPKINLEQYKKFVEPVANQKAEPGNFTSLLASGYGWGAGTSPDDYSPEDVTNQIMLSSVGAAGIGALVLAGVILTYQGAITGLATYAFIAEATLGTVAAGFTGGIIGAAIGAAAGLLIAKMFGIDDMGAVIILAAVGGVLGGVTGGLYITGVSICAGPHLIFCAIVVIIVLIIIAAIFKMIGIGEVKKTNVKFSCEPWQAPTGGKECSKCMDELNKDGLRACTKYKCSSLGQTCEFINPGTSFEDCVDINPNDVLTPKISPWQGLISSGYKYSEINDDGFKISLDNGECLTEFSSVIFGITSDEASECKMDSLHTENFESMEFYFGDSSLFKRNHTMAFNLPSVDSIINELKDSVNESQLANLNSITTSKLGNLTYYVRCMDKKGNYNLKEYLIRTCVKPGPDLTAPYVVATNPEDNSFVSINKNETELKIWTNEPADCKYDYSEKFYEDMNNAFSCENDLQDADLYGWACLTNLTNLNLAENKIFIKCKDQPWLPETNTSRNVMQTSKIMTIKKASNELKIDKIEPNNINITVGNEPVTLTLKAYTSGGAENGKANCEYSFTNSSFIQFYNTYSSTSTQRFDFLMKGSYNIYVRCKDITGDTALGMTSLRIEVDKKTPEIIRVYNKGGLKIITDEDAECVYSFSGCDYSWSNGTKMIGLLKEHTSNFEPGKLYYIKCKYLWNNKPDGCSIIIKTI